MFVQLEVEVKIQKGLGPETITKNFGVAYDDLPEETTKDEIKSMAKREVDSRLYNSIDYKDYGKNWEIIDYHFT